MPWGRVDDSYYDHRKVEELEERDDIDLTSMERLAAQGLFWKVISYCNRQLTDGRFTEAKALKLAPVPRRDAVKLVAALVTVGLWEGQAATYEVHDFLEYNDSRADVLERRRKEAERKAEWRRKKAGHGGSPSGTDGGTTAGTDDGTTPVTPSGTDGGSPSGSPAIPGPARPGPSRSESQVPMAVPARNGRGTSSSEPRLTKAQLDAWASFEAPEWQPFKAAWMARGFLLPPAGEPDDDDTSQRGLLWQIADGRPRSLAEWVTEAKGKSPHQVVEHVLKRWHEARAEAEESDAEQKAASAQRNGRRPMAVASAVLQELDFGTAPAAAHSTGKAAP